MAVLAGPVVLGAFTATVPDKGVVEEQLRVGWPLLAMLMPQVPLYGVAFIGAATMKGHGRFALAAADPAAENIGVMVTSAVIAVMLRNRHEDVTFAQILVLGIGTTAAVGFTRPSNGGRAKGRCHAHPTGGLA